MSVSTRRRATSTSWWSSSHPTPAWQSEIIGGALNRLSSSDPATVERISEHKRSIAFRNVLIHGYEAVSDAVVCDIVETKREELDAILGGGRA